MNDGEAKDEKSPTTRGGAKTSGARSAHALDIWPSEISLTRAEEPIRRGRECGVVWSRDLPVALVYASAEIAAPDRQLPGPSLDCHGAREADPG